MKILIIEWTSFGKEDILDAFHKLGHETVTFSHPDYDLRISDEFCSKLRKYCTDESPDVIFSSNYFPLVSTVCQELNTPYIAWVYDCPHLSLYSATVINKCNHIFIFDSAICDEFSKSGIDTITYLPLAANAARLDRYIPNKQIHDKLDCDISFVGAMYNESHNLYERLTDVNEYTKGYLEGIINSQLMIAGMHLTDKILTNKVLNELRRVQPYTNNPDGVESEEYIYSRYFIDRKITEIERTGIISDLSMLAKLRLYTHNPTPSCPNAINMGAIEYYNDMPYAFKCSKINLNISLRSIESGIPLRVFDIMGAGGFLISNYQADMLMYFEPDKDYVYYEDTNDLKEKCIYYLSHDKARKSIAISGYNKIKQYHTYEMRLKEMLDTI